MINTIVLDACTIINLLRIDDLDGFISKRLHRMVSSTCAVCEEVLNEARRNVLRNSIDDEKRKYIEEQLPLFYTYQIQNTEIKSYQDAWKYVYEASGHVKKENGELFSTVLCLVKSRKEQVRSLFYTDDLPAQREFEDVFSHQQIGYISDTAHLLIYLYVNSGDEVFSLNKLKMFLFNLRAEYNRDTMNLVKEAKKCLQKCNSKKYNDYINALKHVINGFYASDEKEYKTGVEYLQSKSGVFDTLDNVIMSVSASSNLEIVQRITNVMEYIDKYPIFRNGSNLGAEE